MSIPKTVTSTQLDDIFREYCLKHNYIYEGYQLNQYNSVVLCFQEEYNLHFGLTDWRRFGYHMHLDENNRFIDVIRGLNKKLKGKQIIDIENVKKSNQEC